MADSAPRKYVIAPLEPPNRRLLLSLNPAAPLLGLWRNRALIRQFTRREIQGRYRGSMLGILWSFGIPLMTLAVYAFVFGIVFRSRWPGMTDQSSLGQVALMLFAGMIAFNVFGESVMRAPSLIATVPNYVKKVVFPLDVLPVAALGSALFHALCGLLILIAGAWWVQGHVPWTIFLLPVLMLPLVMLSLGLAWFLAGLGVFLRDIGYLVGVIVQILWFGTPVFYPVQAVPEQYRWLMTLNPLTTSVESMRSALLYGPMPSAGNLSFSFIFGFLVMLLGYGWFTQTRRAFADVI